MHVLTNIDTNVFVFVFSAVPSCQAHWADVGEPAFKAFLFFYLSIYFLASTCSAIHQSESIGDILSNRYSCALVKAEHNVLSRSRMCRPDFMLKTSVRRTQTHQIH